MLINAAGSKLLFVPCFPALLAPGEGTALLLTWLPALMTAGVSSGLASLISSGSVPAIPIQAGSVQRAWMSDRKSVV